MDRLASFFLRRPAAAVAAALVVTAVLGLGALRVGTDTGYRAFLGDDHPAVRELEAAAARFGGGVPFAIVYACGAGAPCESVFDAKALEMAHALAVELAGLDGVARVESPATSAIVAPAGFGLPEARALAPDGVPVEDVEALALRARRDPVWVGQIVSEDGKHGAVVVQLADASGATAERVVDAVRAMLAGWEAKGFRYALVGGPVEFVVAGRELDQQVQKLVPGIVVLVGIVLLFAFRRIAPSILALATAGLALVWTIGLQGWLGWPRTSFFQVLPPLMLTVGVCYGIHVISTYVEALASLPSADALTRAEREPILRRTLAEVGRPALYTALTTAAGFFSFLTSPLESLSRFGTIAAFGVLAAFAATFLLLPLVLVRLPARAIGEPVAHAAWSRLVGAIADGVAGRRVPILLATAAATALGLVGITRLSIDARFEEVYGEQSDVVRWAREAAALRGGDTLEVVVKLPPGLSPTSAESLRALDALEALGGLDGLGRPLSILAALRSVNDAVHDDPLVVAGEAADPTRAGQLHRLVRGEAPAFARSFVAPDEGEGAALRISYQGDKLPQDELRTLVDRVKHEAEGVVPPGSSVVVTGPLAIVSRMIDEIRDTQIGSFGAALALVFALSALCLRSFSLALFAMIPTTIPVALTLGAMGFLGIPLDMGTTMVASVLLGLGVDEALHLLSSYRRRRDQGDLPGDAIDAALRDVGRALFTTAGALAAGFLVLFFVPWKSLSSFGLVTGVAIGASLLADLVLLPSVMGGARRRDAG